MKFLTICLIFIHASKSWAITCNYGIDTCKENQSCIKINQEKAECISSPEIIPNINFPMKVDLGIYCDQGNLSPDYNSHIYSNTAYAVDLVSNRNSNAAQIFASSTGLVVSNSTCNNQNDQCGNGFGNYVQILRDDGFLIFYAHLDEVYVKTGDVISEGTKIGIEGNTGWTGKNNRHLHFSVHYDWRSMGFDLFKDNLGYLPNSVPFKMNACQSNQLNCKSKFVDVRELICTRITDTLDWLKIIL